MMKILSFFREKGVCTGGTVHLLKEGFFFCQLPAMVLSFPPSLSLALFFFFNSPLFVHSFFGQDARFTLSYLNLLIFKFVTPIIVPLFSFLFSSRARRTLFLPQNGRLFFFPHLHYFATFRFLPLFLVTKPSSFRHFTNPFLFWMCVHSEAHFRLSRRGDFFFFFFFLLAEPSPLF